MRDPVTPSLGTVLYFHGGHESATTAAAAEVYTELGYTVVAPSRTGYGSTEVGRLSAADFAPVVDDVRAHLGIDAFVATVGTSFGGQEAIQYVVQRAARSRSLVLHSAAPSTRPYPDSAAQRLLGPLVFHPAIEGHVWHAVGALLRRAPDLGLRLMASSLSTRPTGTWLPDLSASDRAELRELFTTMRSRSGFSIDLAHARRTGSAARRAAQRAVRCPTLVTASHDDRGVRWAHAADLAATIPLAQLVDLPAPSHLFWIGPARSRLSAVVAQTLAAARDAA